MAVRFVDKSLFEICGSLRHFGMDLKIKNNTLLPIWGEFAFFFLEAKKRQLRGKKI